MANILKFLKEHPNSRKIFGKGELNIIERQLLGINLTQSEKNRLSRDIRKKLNFIKDISKFKDEFNLKKAGKVKEMINEVLEDILNDKLRRNIKEIWLFGSVAKNEITVRSDVDIVVLFDEIDLREATKFRARIAGNFSKKLDIQVFRFLPEKIQKSILENHKILWKK